MVLFPLALFRLFGMEAPPPPGFWQCIGVIVGVYGVACAAAGLVPLRSWPVVMDGFLGKVPGSIRFVGAVARGVVPIPFNATIVPNGLMGSAPFPLILPQTDKPRHKRKGATA